MASPFSSAVEALEASVRRSAPFRSWLRSRRWCGEAVGARTELAVMDLAVLAETGSEALVLVLARASEGGSSVVLHLPLSLAKVRFGPDAFEFSVAGDRFYVLEAERREAYARLLVGGFRGGPTIRTRAGATLRFLGGDLGAFRSLEPAATRDSSNLLLRVTTSKGTALFKSYKFLDPHNREPAILERLERRRFPHSPRLLGQVSLGRGRERVVIAVATRHIDAADLFAWLVEGWRNALSSGPRLAGSFEERTVTLAADLGEATAALHDALVDRKPGPFRAESFTPADARAAIRLATKNLADSLRRLARRAAGDRILPQGLAADSRELLLDRRGEIEDVLGLLTASVGTVKSVTHADLHLGQVLRSSAHGELTFIDFEGEPERAPGLRSVKLPPLRDVATMIRSFAYVRHAVSREHLGAEATAVAIGPRPDDVPSTARATLRTIESWELAVSRVFRERYLARTSLYPELDQDAAESLIRGWAMEKALYELRYELIHRPLNFLIPLDGVLTLAERR